MWKIPLSDIDFNQREVAAAVKVINSKWLTMGEVTHDFERKFADFLSVKHAIAVSSCTAALHLANLALNIGKGDEVICPSLTFVAGSNSILYTGARPVFADITSIGNFNISPDDIKKMVTKRTKAIHVMHYAGFPCDMERILDIAKKNGLSVIEDCAHAIGSRYRAKMCGAIGDIGCFSFFSNKNMTTGEGGMVTTNNDNLARRIKLMRSHGMTSLSLDRHRGHAFSYDVVELGCNYRIDELRSALGIVQLDKLKKNNLKRKNLFEHYVRNFKNMAGISVPFRGKALSSSYHIFSILLDKGVNRLKFMEYMKKKGIQTSVHYPAVHLFNYYRRRFNYPESMLPITCEVANREVTLPLFPCMKEKDVNYVCRQIKNFFNR